MNREQLMKMSKKELKARLVTVGKEAQDKSGEELTALMDEAKTIGEILDEIKAREELARAAAAAATEGEEPEDDTKGGEGAETKDKARAESGKALKNGKAVKFKAKALKHNHNRNGRCDATPYKPGYFPYIQQCIVPYRQSKDRSACRRRKLSASLCEIIWGRGRQYRRGGRLQHI